MVKRKFADVMKKCDIPAVELKVIREARDGNQLCKQWHREMETPDQKYPTIPKAQVNTEENQARYFDGFQTWLLMRGLDDELEFEDVYEGGWMVYHLKQCEITWKH